MNSLTVRKYNEMCTRIRLAIRENDDNMLEEGILSPTVHGVPIRKLFVCNLASRTSYVNLTVCFSAYGTVESCFLQRIAGKKSNYAFVTFSKVEEAMCARAAGQMKSIILHGRELRVMPAYSWHQPDSPEKQYRSERKNSSEQLDRNENTESYTTINDTSTCINTLNDDCLMHIFHYLKIVDRVRIERVCKRWRAISKESWRSMQSLDLSIATWGFPLDDKSTPINDSRLRQVLLRCGRFLNHIYITDCCQDLSFSALTLIAKMCKNIQTIDITAVTVSTAGISSLADNCKDIRKLCLGYTIVRCDSPLAKLFTQNEKIRHLDIHGNDFSGKCLHSLNADCLEELSLRKCTSLNSFHVANAISKFKHLRTLSIIRCIGIIGTVMESIGTHCNNLKTLELVDSFPTMLTEDMLHIAKVVGLETLRIEMYLGVTDDFLITLASKCKQLTEIDISACIFVTDIGIAALATLPRLQHLTVSHLDKITAVGLQDMCNLRRFVCHRCLNLSDEGIATVMKQSPNLELLDLSGCVGITNSTLEIAAVLVSERTNNTILKIFVGGTSIRLGRMAHVPPFLQIVNVDLSAGPML